MHHFRITLSGAEGAVRRSAAGLEVVGAARVHGRELVWSSARGLEDVREFSRQHPDVGVGVEWFEDFEDELVHGVVTAGDFAVLAQRPLLEPGWGSFHDEDGEPLDEGSLARAGAALLRAGPVTDGDRPDCGLGVALLAARELGRFEALAGEWRAAGAPDAQILAGVARLGRFGLEASVPFALPGPDLEHGCALQATRAVLHAGRSEFAEDPPSWERWLGTLLWSVSGLMEAVSWDDAPLGGPGVSEHFPGPAERLDLEGRSLATTCVQVLALFPARAPSA